MFDTNLWRCWVTFCDLQCLGDCLRPVSLHNITLVDLWCRFCRTKCKFVAVMLERVCQSDVRNEEHSVPMSC